MASISDSFSIRPASNADAQAVTELIFSILRSYNLAPDPADTDRDLADIEGFYVARGGFFDLLVAEPAGEIVGTVALLPYGDSSAELRKMYLHPAYRRRGLGRRLLVHGIQRARAMGIRTMILETATVLREAVALYERFGFKASQRHSGVARCDKILEAELSNIDPIQCGYVIRDGMEAMDFGRIQPWLAATYWTPGIGRDRVERAARNSAMVVGAFAFDKSQVGFARVVSDKTRFAYFCDVIVDVAHQKRGLARAMVNHVLTHPDFATVITWTLATRDAHGVYAPLGFKPMADPESRAETWMVRRVRSKFGDPAP